MTSQQRQSAGNIFLGLYRTLIATGMAIIGWGGVAFYEANQTALREMTALANANARTIAAMTISIQTALSDRYTASDASRDFKIRDQRDDEIDRRVTNVESEVREIGRRVPPTPDR